MSGRSQAFFPFLPGFSTWEEFNGNLVMYYSQNNISFNTEDDWQTTAREIAQSSTFSAYGTPDPMTYDNWEDWALEFGNLVNGSLKR